jgi:hypothetical protein
MVSVSLFNIEYNGGACGFPSDDSDMTRVLAMFDGVLGWILDLGMRDSCLVWPSDGVVLAQVTSLEERHGHERACKRAVEKRREWFRYAQGMEIIVAIMLPETLFLPSTVYAHPPHLAP